ncbi:hypothetical protein PIB30_076719 [Stylosanthes scabra]|uniref:Uncharacterized protein n=1 Tax=Stylosanthes scabra TaxID=79078 RepID=A0ABU6TTA3_9FABA|nr:hypothetical protein [Stylosanthes scabra]
MTVSLLLAYVTDWWFLNHIDNIALTDTIGKPYPVKRTSDNVGLRAVNRRMSSWPALGTGMHHSCLPHFCPPFPQPANLPPPPSPKPLQPNSIEAALERLTLSTVDFIQSTNNFFDEAKSNFKNHGEAIRRLEVQMGDIAKQLAHRHANTFPSDTIPNPREKCKAINVKLVEEAPKEKQEAEAEK